MRYMTSCKYAGVKSPDTMGNKDPPGDALSVMLAFGRAAESASIAAPADMGEGALSENAYLKSIDGLR